MAEIEAMGKTTETARTVKVTDFVQGCPPAVLISETVSGPSGRSRLFTQKVQVPNAGLWERLAGEVAKGGSIRVTVKTIWPDSGPYYTCLGSFVRLKMPASIPALAIAAV